MEPRSWKWIQAAVIAAAVAVGIGAAVWYQNRSSGDGIPVPSPGLTRRTVARTDDSDVPAPTAPLKLDDLTGAPAQDTAPGLNAAVSTSSPTARPAGAPLTVDPMTHLQVTPPPEAAPFPGIPAVVAPAPAFSPSVPSGPAAAPAASPQALPPPAAP